MSGRFQAIAKGCLIVAAVQRAIDRARESRTIGQARVTPVKIIERFCYETVRESK